MQVSVILADVLLRTTDPSASRVPKVVMSYTDRRSGSDIEALDECWRICNAAPHLLDETEQQLRDVWDSAAGGLGLSVGDVVEVDGRPYECRPDGWKRSSR